MENHLGKKLYNEKKRQSKKSYTKSYKIYWAKGLQICGMDEVGRGCLAGPVVTSSVILFENVYHPDLNPYQKSYLEKITRECING